MSGPKSGLQALHVYEMRQIYNNCFYSLRKLNKTDALKKLNMYYLCASKKIFNCKCNFLVETFCSRMPMMLNKSEITFGLVLKHKSYFHIEIRDMYRRSPVKSPDIKTL